MCLNAKFEYTMNATLISTSTTSTPHSAPANAAGQPTVSPHADSRSITLLICALGGEGGGVLTEWLIDVARQAGFAAQSTSIPGVAQRTGATTYYLEVFPVPLAELGGKRPIFSLNPVPGALDGLVSSELLETARQGTLGMPSGERTLVITSSARTLTTQERIDLGDGRASTEDLLGVVRAVSREHHVLDMAGMAQRAGTVVSAVMLGTVAASGLFPFPRAAYEAVIGRGGASNKGAAAASLRGFASGWDAVATPRAQAAMVEALSREVTGLNERKALENSEQTIDSGHAEKCSIFDEFPVQARDTVQLGHARMLDYQGANYAALYLSRLRLVVAAEKTADPAGEQGFKTSAEMARWLALWMAFDDIVRVADLKSRASRWSRVKTEVKAKDEDLVKLYDHFKPGVPEFAALLPPSLATRITAWDRARVMRGKLPWALPLKVGTHSVGGMLALRFLAKLKWLRVRGQRYATEQAMIEHWLGGVVRGTLRDWRLGHEIALCGRLIKGYGSTNERGKENLAHVLDHLAQGVNASAAAQAVALAREAALADDAGKALDATLVQHGAPARPVKAVPIRFVRNVNTGRTPPTRPQA
jgi:indolepyruvate ferredoxin oxidoreductase, beta subunit